METSDGLKQGRVAGFWIRCLADLLDALLLGLVGMLIAALFHEPLARMGERAVFIGLAISLLYSGVLQSRFGGGQTAGKAVLGLRVVRLDGSLLSLDRSLVRYALVGCLYYGGAVTYALLAIMPFLAATLVSSIQAGAQLVLFLGCALMVPFHPLKRGLHDLLTGSIVVRHGMPPADVIARGNRPARDRRLVIGAGGLALAATIVGWGMSGTLVARFQPSLGVARTMREMGIQNPGVTELVARNDGVSHRSIVATGFIPAGAGQPALAERQREVLAAIRLQMSLDGVDQIGVVLRSGINIGIYSSTDSTQLLEPAHGN